MQKLWQFWFWSFCLAGSSGGPPVVPLGQFAAGSTGVNSSPTSSKPNFGSVLSLPGLRYLSILQSVSWAVVLAQAVVPVTTGSTGRPRFCVRSHR